MDGVLGIGGPPIFAPCLGRVPSGANGLKANRSARLRSVDLNGDCAAADEVSVRLPHVERQHHDIVLMRQMARSVPDDDRAIGVIPLQLAGVELQAGDRNEFGGGEGRACDDLFAANRLGRHLAVRPHRHGARNKHHQGFHG